MKAGLTEIVMVLDRSGSMSSTKDDAEGGLRTFVAEQRKVPGDCRMTFYRFDDVIERVFDNKLLASVQDKELVLEPRNWTALLDAMGRAMEEVGRRLAETPEAERPSKVIFVTITDGMENASKHFKRQDIFDMVSLQRDTFKWEFVFIGANQDAIATAKDYGITAAAALSSSGSPIGTQNVYSSLSKNVAKVRVTGGSMAWSTTDRKKAQEK